MTINIENELKKISVRLESLSQRVDKMAAGIVKPKKSKPKSAFKKGASMPEVPADKNDFNMKDDISSVLVHGAGDVEPEISPEL